MSHEEVKKSEVKTTSILNHYYDITKDVANIISEWHPYFDTIVMSVHNVQNRSKIYVRLMSLKWLFGTTIICNFGDIKLASMWHQKMTVRENQKLYFWTHQFSITEWCVKWWNWKIKIWISKGYQFDIVNVTLDLEYFLVSL